MVQTCAVFRKTFRDQSEKTGQNGAGRAAWIAVASLVLLLIGCGGGEDSALDEPLDRAAYIEAMSLGKAYFENKETTQAVEAFSQATAQHPTESAAWRNLARAQLLARDSVAAKDALGQAALVGGASAATSYLLGITEARENAFSAAAGHLETAVELDPDLAAIRFQLANAYQNLNRHDEAQEQLAEVLRLDPLHSTAHYKLAVYAQQAGKRREFEARQRDFLRLRQLLGEEGRSAEALEDCVYTRAETIPAERTSTPSIPISFADVTDAWFGEAAASALAVLDVDPDGRTAIVTASAAGLTVRRGGADGLREETAASADYESALQLAVGDFHNIVPQGKPYDSEAHAHNDLAVVAADGRLSLWRGEPDGSLTDVTAPSGLGDVVARRVAWIDYESDGDLDLAVATRERLELWQNNGNGTFEEVASTVGVTLEEPIHDFAVADLDGNGALDLIAAGPGGTVVFENQRTGSFRQRPDPPGPWPAASRVLADDLDHDGRPDAVLVSGGEIVLFQTGSEAPIRLATAPFEPSEVALADLDNDGWLDLLATGTIAENPDGGALRLWRHGGSGEWLEISAAAGLANLELSALGGLRTADVDADGDSDLLLATASGTHALRNDGGEHYRQLKLRLAGTKTNPTGLGTRLEIRQGDFVLTRTVSQLPVEIGLGDRPAPEVVRIEWTNGIIDNQFENALEGPLTVVEKNVASGSCPFLYAWDGEEFRFVTDVLGNSPVGLSLRRGVPLDADPDEWVEIGPAESFPPRDGRYLLQVTEEMREALYLDEAFVVAVDHPAEIEVHSTDKLMPAPFPESELIPLTALRSPHGVASSDGQERVEALRTIDNHFSEPGVRLPPPLRGMTEELALTLDFGPIEASRPLVLALTGWLQYGDASTNIALSQGAAPVIMPRLEAETATGFKSVDALVGLPAGKTKTILVDLAGKLPADTKRLRLTTNIEVRWDRIALGERLPAASIKQYVLRPESADLYVRGFSDIRARATGHPTTPRFADVAPRPPWTRSLQGFVTALGDVRDLVTSRDDRLAVLVGGDAIELAFDALALPEIPADRQRTFFFYSVGWDKDGDENVIDGDRIEPLPIVVDLVDESEDWLVRRNTRWIAKDRFASR